MARGQRVQISLTEFNLQLMKTGPSEQNSTFPGKGHSSTVLTICSLTLLLLADQELKTFIKNIYKQNNLLSLKIQTNSETHQPFKL